MWICVGPRDPATKPSQEGWLWAVVRKPRLFLVEIAAARNKVGEIKGLRPEQPSFHRLCGGL